MLFHAFFLDGELYIPTVQQLAIALSYIGVNVHLQVV